MEEPLERQRTADQAVTPHKVARKKMKFTQQDQQHSEPTSGRSSAMEISNTKRNEDDSLRAISLTDEDLQDVADRLEVVSLMQLDDEATMTQEEQDEFYKRALLRAIAEDGASSRAGEDRDW